jgi:hypothetical protein
VGAFLRTQEKPRRVIIEVPFPIPHDAQFEIRSSTAAYDGGYVNVYQDGHLAVTVARDGKIEIGGTLP